MVYFVRAESLEFDNQLFRIKFSMLLRVKCQALCAEKGILN
jgi:hypothetical protein